jgi:predicted transcriptional regulator
MNQELILTVHVALSPDLYQSLGKIAKHREWPVSQVGRKAIVEFIERERKANPALFFSGEPNHGSLGDTQLP